MKFFSRTMSRRVHEAKNEERISSCGTSTLLTVWTKSLVLSCNGFTVIDSNGNLAYRVDNYIGCRGDVIVLMDGLGKPVLSLCRRFKKLRLLDNWLVYEGDIEDQNCTTESSSNKPLFYVKKHSRVLHTNSMVLAHVYHENTDKRHAYVIEGSYAERSCKVLDESRKIVAEIKRKEEIKVGISFGVEVFVLIVKPGFDSGFAMALVLLLDQMF